MVYYAVELAPGRARTAGSGRIVMEGYDKNEALSWMAANFDKKACPGLAKRLEEALSAAIDADFEYMEKAGVLEGKSYYDDDDAFEYLADALAAKLNARTDKERDSVEDFVDQYMELQQSFMEEKGLLGWD